MKYNLYKPEDLTWDNAVSVACRWESAHNEDPSDSSASDDGDDVEVVECSKKRSKSKKGESKTIISPVESTAPPAPTASSHQTAPWSAPHQMAPQVAPMQMGPAPTTMQMAPASSALQVAPAQTMHLASTPAHMHMAHPGMAMPIASASVTVAALRSDYNALSDEVKTNARDIKGIKSEQERLGANMVAWQAETSQWRGRNDARMDRIIDAVCYPQQGAQQAPQQFQPRVFQPRMPQKNYQRPANHTWKGHLGQTQQTGFRFNRSTPQQYNRQPQGATHAPVAAATAAAPAAATTQNAAPAAAAAAPPAAVAPVAAYEEIDPAAQTLNEEFQDAAVQVSYRDYLSLQQRAYPGIEEHDVISSLQELNFI